MDITTTFFFNKSKRIFFNYETIAKLVSFFLLLITSVAFSCASAATQGKLGKSSTASIGISVHVNQSLIAVSPDELLLHQTTSEKKQFCVRHFGYKLNSTVPYELKVDEISTAHNKNPTLPLKVFLEYNQSIEQKQLLTQGKTFYNQSEYSINGSVNCQDKGMNLSLEIANQNANIEKQGDTVGVMILLVSPN